MKLTNTEAQLTGERQLDRARLVAMIAYEGRTASEAAKEFHATVPAIKRELVKGPVVKMLEKAHEHRLQIVSEVPIANYARRLGRLETLYKNAEAEGDYKIQIQTLREAREETKDLVPKELQEEVAPKITVNIGKWVSQEDDTISQAVEVEAQVLPEKTEDLLDA